MHKFSSFYNIQVKSWAVQLVRKTSRLIVGGLDKQPIIALGQLDINTCFTEVVGEGSSVPKYTFKIIITTYKNTNIS